MLRRLYDYVMTLAARPRAAWALALVAFAESSFFPIPPDVMLVPMVLAKRTKAWAYATICTIASILGGAAGYLIGWIFFATLGQGILNFYGLTTQFDSFAGRYNDYGAWIVLFAGLTPFPFEVITIASGATGLNFWVFMLASLIARSGRFFMVAGLLYLFGPPIRDFIEKRLVLVTTVFLVLLFGGFLAVKFML
ncbi:MAG: DedA family protein [Rhizobiales bacterium]|nr:DedA family protein [Hyphomicrobiales bacterium]